MLKGTFLRSRIGRRIFCLFICCSIIPITALALISFVQVTKNLEEQASRRLFQSAKAVGFSILDRLLILDDELRKTGSEYMNVRLEISPVKMADEGLGSSPFKTICIYNANPLPTVIRGTANQTLPASEVPLPRPASGKSTLFTRRSDSLQTRIFLARPVQSEGSGILVGEIDPAHLWNAAVEHSLPPMNDVCIVDHHGDIIISSISNPKPLFHAKGFKRETENRGFPWTDRNETYIADSYDLFLRSRFEAEDWLVVVSQSKEILLAPMAEFRAIFPGIAVLTVLIVALISMYYIRRVLVPLERMKEGIEHISRRDFKTRITVDSKDEFYDLAATFNEMSAHLGKQFQALTTISKIDRAILSSLDTGRIISTVLGGIGGFLTCDRISISLLDTQRHVGTNYYPPQPDIDEDSEPVRFTPAEIMQITGNREMLTVTAQETIPGYLAPLNKLGVRFFLILPVFVKNRPAATINLGYSSFDSPPDDDLLHARQIADQMAVALSNSSLVEELDELNWGTLKALARTVDAKSKWTAGHSERVFETAMIIAEAHGFSPTELSLLHRGALLHDIGKVGIPNRILDKPAKLTPEEYDLIKTHPQIGADILEPITAYQEAVPIVLQHHEKFDGSGYPAGLRGEQIHIGARILAVADVFDAMAADRPYRRGLELEEVFRYIAEGKGTHFDPKVVESFFAVISRAS